MNELHGWMLSTAPLAECPDCGERVGPDSDLGSLVEAVRAHVCEASDGED